jgi:response regulator RpfG family c-di-GMP phosphodiesterase
MDKEITFTTNDDTLDELVFADEAGGALAAETGAANHSWELLIVDDEEDVHRVTRMVLGDFNFMGRGVTFHHAYSGEEAKGILRQQDNIALVLLDVVMESDDSGLQLVKFIREEIKNPFIRIILRTGQPGLAPLKSVIVDYDINDYKEKGELTDEKLYATMVATLRDYQRIMKLEENRRSLELNKAGLEKIIHASNSIFELQSLRTFAQGVLLQFESLSGLDVHSIYTQVDGFSAIQERRDFKILAGTGCYSDRLESKVDEVLNQTDLERISKAIETKTNQFGDDYFVCQVQNSEGAFHILYLHGDQLSVKNVDQKLIEAFNTNISIAFENLHLNQEIKLTQREIIYTLGEVTEARSYETGYHVKRVGEYSKIMARGYGLSMEQSNLLKISSALHDVGKVGIPDSILNKPGPLTPEEFEVMKQHTVIGKRLLGRSKREILRTAATIAHQHHEYHDGNGYPQGLKGDEIDIFARITAVSDVFDALSSDRIYRAAWDDQKIFDFIREQSGRMFDPKVVEVFFDSLPDLMEIRTLFAD